MSKKLSIRQFIGYLLYPNRCAFCNDIILMDQEICETCKESLPYISGKICQRCGCEKAYCKCGNALQFDRAIAPFYYVSPYNRGLLKFKNNRERWRADIFAKHIGNAVRDAIAGENIDFAVRVPDHSNRTKTGNSMSSIGLGVSPNQTLAEAVCDNLRLELIPDMIYYYAETPSQQRGLGRNERFANVFGAFEIKDSYRVFGKNILLIDDVMTTGATAGECAKMLKLYGAEKVFCATLLTTKQEKRA